MSMPKLPKVPPHMAGAIDLGAIKAQKAQKEQGPPQPVQVDGIMLAAAHAEGVDNDGNSVVIPAIIFQFTNSGDAVTPPLALPDEGAMEIIARMTDALDQAREEARAMMNRRHTQQEGMGTTDSLGDEV